MDDPEKEPLLFANRAIQHYAKAFLDDVELTPRDCTKIRVMFRSLGGSWFEIAQGDSAMRPRPRKAGIPDLLLRLFL
jgi:hypothetical protein